MSHVLDRQKAVLHGLNMTYIASAVKAAVFIKIKAWVLVLMYSLVITWCSF